MHNPPPTPLGVNMQSKNIKMYRADTDTITASIKRGTKPLDLTGAVVVFSVKQNEDSETYVIQKTSTDVSDLEIIDAENGICYIYFVEDDTAELSPGFYFYDIEVTLVSGSIKTVAKGFLIIEQDITD